jgi:hypothetical protein
MAIKKEILDELLNDRDPKTMFSSDGLLGELKKAIAERILNVEMDQHLADSTQEEVSEAEKAGNHRNGYNKKTVLTDNKALELSIPRDRRGTFEPQLIAKYQRRFPGFDDKIVSMYARGMSTREIQGHLRELYGIEASPQLISTVTDAVLEEVGRWQSRPLDPLYALVFKSQESAPTSMAACGVWTNQPGSTKSPGAILDAAAQPRRSGAKRWTSGRPRPRAIPCDRCRGGPSLQMQHILTGCRFHAPGLV